MRNISAFSRDECRVLSRHAAASCIMAAVCVGVRDIASWWSCKLRHVTQMASCHHFMNNGLPCVQSNTQIPTSSFDMIVNTTLPRHMWCPVCWEEGDERGALFADGSGGPRSALQQGMFVLPSAFTTAARACAPSLPPRSGLRAASLKPCCRGAKVCKPTHKCCATAWEPK